jgi:hypothetical protein
MPQREILVCREGEGWRVHCEGALFERIACVGDAIRVARKHAYAADRAGVGSEIRIRNDRRPR